LILAKSSIIGKSKNRRRTAVGFYNFSRAPLLINVKRNATLQRK
jgi:hypothetical protein